MNFIGIGLGIAYRYGGQTENFRIATDFHCFEFFIDLGPFRRWSSTNVVFVDQVVQGLVGNRCQTLATTVVQVSNTYFPRFNTFL